jgi:RHS repeat-associated protein
VVEIDRDASGRATRETCGEAWVASRWGHHGLRSSFESSRGASVEIVRNAVGDPERVVVRDEAHRWACVIGRDANGREIDRRLPGGVRAYTWRDGAGRATQAFVGIEGGAHRLQRSAWDDGLQRIEIGDAITELERDASGRVIATQCGESVQGRHFDAAGNVFGDASLGDRSYAGARLQSMGGMEFRYDADGRRIEREHADGRQWRYHWDAADRLVQVDRPDGTAVAFEYDALGRRVRRNAAGRVTRWSWDGDVPVHEWCEEAEPPVPRDPPAQASRRAARLAAKAMLVRARGGEAGEAEWIESLRQAAPRDPVAARLLAEHVRGPAPVPEPTEAVTWVFTPETFAPMCRVGASTGARSIVTDDLGVPTCLVDEAGAFVWSSAIDVHGRVHDDPQACPFRFPGQYDDREVDLSYNRHRWYDASTGAYLSPDPLGLYGGLAAYAYVADPFAHSDPLGLAACMPADPLVDLRSPIAFPEPPDPLARTRPHRPEPRDDLSAAAAVSARTRVLDR